MGLFTSTGLLYDSQVMYPSLLVENSSPKYCIFNIVNLTSVKFCFIYLVLVLAAHTQLLDYLDVLTTLSLCNDVQCVSLPFLVYSALFLIKEV